MACTGGSQAREGAQEFQSVTSTGCSSAAVAAFAAASVARQDGAAFGAHSEALTGAPSPAQGERQLLLRVRPGGPKWGRFGPSSYRVFLAQELRRMPFRLLQCWTAPC
jgi:hypothetical protein